jgi:hypothetical protein
MFAGLTIDLFVSVTSVSACLIGLTILVDSELAYSNST